jgi:flagellar basal body rod protein FlgC
MEGSGPLMDMGPYYLTMMVNLMGASRGYQANVNALLAVRDMLHRSLDLLT